jgi:general secretion pathway protein K
LTNLVTQDSINPSEVEAFGRLLTLLRQDPALANVISRQIAAASGAALNLRPDSFRQIGFVQLDDLLAVPGCTPQLINAIRAHAVFLPVSTPVNINTASPEVLAARVPGLSMADANTLINSRRQAAFRDLADLATRLPNGSLGFDGARLGVTSNYFIVTGRVTIRSATLQIQALVERQPSATRLLWVKEI